MLCIQLLWTKDVTDALRRTETDRKVVPKTKLKMANLLNSILGRMTLNASAVDRIKFESLVILQTYYRDAFSDLVSILIFRN